MTVQPSFRVRRGDSWFAWTGRVRRAAYWTGSVEDAAVWRTRDAAERYALLAGDGAEVERFLA